MNDEKCWLCGVETNHDLECPYTVGEVNNLSDVHPLDDFIHSPDIMMIDLCLEDIEAYSSVSDLALGRAK